MRLHRSENDQAGSFSLPPDKLIPIAKYLLAVVILIFIIWMFLRNAGSDASFEEVASAVEAVIDTESLQEGDASDFKRNYGLTAADYEGVLLYISVYNMQASEVLLVKVSDASQVSEIEEAIDSRLTALEADFGGYLPEQEELINQAQVTTRGNFVFLAISSDVNAYTAAFLNGL